MPLWYHKTDDYRWLTGSIRQDLQPDERSVWADFLALAGLTREPRRGYIERSEGIPYDKKYLLTFLNITEDLFDRSVAKCVKEGRLQVFPDGTMYLTNFKVYNPDVSPKGEAKATAIEQAKLRRKSLTDAVLTLVRQLNQQNKLLLKLDGKTDDLAMATLCPFCGLDSLNDGVDLARHIITARDDKHQDGIDWARHFLSNEEKDGIIQTQSNELVQHGISARPDGKVPDIDEKGQKF